MQGKIICMQINGEGKVYKSVAYTVSTRLLLILTQLVLFLCIFKLYDKELAGYYTLAMGTFSISLLFFSFTISKFIVVKYKRRSYTFFFCVVLVASFISFFMLLPLVTIVEGLPVRFILLLFFIKVLDLYNEMNLIYYRRNSLEIKLFFIQLLRTALVVFMFFSGAFLNINLDIVLVSVILIYTPFFLLDCLRFKLKGRYVCSYYLLWTYKKMYHTGWKSGVSGTLSTLFTHSPKYFIALFMTMELVAIYSLVAYIYITTCTFGSLVLQVLFAKVDDFKSFWFRSLRRFILCLTGVASFISVMTYFTIEPLYKLFAGDQDIDLAVFSALLCLLPIPLIYKDYFSYYLVKENRISISSYATFISIVIFWFFGVLFKSELTLNKISILLLLSSFTSMFFIYYYTLKNKDLV